MKKKCKYCNKTIDVCFLSFFFDVYCKEHSVLNEWRNTQYPALINYKYNDHGKDKLIIVKKGDKRPSYPYSEEVDIKINSFVNDHNSLFLVEKTQSSEKLLIKLKNYDCNRGYISYYDYDDSEQSKEKSLFIFDIYTIERVYEKQWYDLKGYKGALQDSPDAPIHSKGDEDHCIIFKLGQEYDVFVDRPFDSLAFYKHNYYSECEGNGGSETPFRFCPELIDVFEWFSEVIISPLTTNQKIFHVKAYHAAKLVNGHTGWTTQKIVFEREVTPDEIIDYFNDPDLRDQLYSILENKKDSYDYRTSDQIWQDYVNSANTQNK